MLSHFFPSFFNNATQQITSNHGFLNIKTVILHDLFFLSIFIFAAYSNFTHVRCFYMQGKIIAIRICKLN